jgi:hypothetical protein
VKDDHPKESSFFASAERTSEELINRRTAILASTPLVGALLNATSDAILIVDDHRQIVFASNNFAPLLPAGDLRSIIGLRPGESLGCVYSHVCEGCGTSEQCRECGAVEAILAGLNGDGSAGECVLTRCNKEVTESFHLHVKSTPLTFNGDRFAIVAFSDILPLKTKPAPCKILSKDNGGIKKCLSRLRDRLRSGLSRK